MSTQPPSPAADAPFVAELVQPAQHGSFGTVGTFAIMLALAGLFGLCFSGGLVVTNYNAPAPTAPAADASAVERFEYAIRVEWQGVAARYVPALAGFFAWHLVAVLLLIVGGIRLLRPAENSRQFMLYVLLFVLLFETVRSATYLVMLLEMMPLVDQVVVRELRNADAQMEPILKRMAQGVTIVGIIAALVWPALKILFYGWAARYLASREATELCLPKTAPPTTN